MNLQKVDGIYVFNDYKSFFKFINNYEGDLVVKKYNVFSEGNLIATFNHNE